MQDNTGCSIFIRNIPYTATEDQLQVRSLAARRTLKPRWPGESRIRLTSAPSRRPSPLAVTMSARASCSADGAYCVVPLCA
jgi:hypothetical protein